MGADVTLHTKDDEIYFRDAYNLSNLAWVIGSSYWGAKNKLAFMRKLSKITDEQIKVRVDMLFTTKKEQIADGENPRDWIKGFKNKRDTLHKLFSQKKVIKVTWSV